MVTPPISQNTLLIPALGTPLIDPVTGKCSREWYRFFTQGATAIGPSPTPIPDPIAVLPPPSADVPDGPTEGDLLGAAGFAAQAIGMIQNLQQQISDLQQSSLPPSIAAGLANMLANAHIFVGNGSGVAADVAVSGDLTLANTGAFTNVTIAGQALGTFSTQLIGKGTATNDDAAPGYIGEFDPSTVLVGSAVALATGVVVNVASIALAAGDYDLTVGFGFTGGATTNVTQLTAAIHTTNAALSNLPGSQSQQPFPGGAILFNVQDVMGVVGPRRVSLAAPATMYFNAFAAFTISTCSAYGIIRARRVR